MEETEKEGKEERKAKRGLLFSSFCTCLLLGTNTEVRLKVARAMQTEQVNKVMCPFFKQAD
jgi:hypothetical protein